MKRIRYGIALINAKAGECVTVELDDDWLSLSKVQEYIEKKLKESRK